MSQYELEVSKEYNASAEMIYDAWLDTELIKQFMCPGEGVTVPNPVIDGKVGGRFEFDMKVGENLLPHRGEYKVLDRPNKIQFTWVSSNTNNQDSLVTITINPTGETTCKLTLHHEMLPTESSRDDHNGGWTRIIDQLSKKVSL